MDQLLDEPFNNIKSFSEGRLMPGDEEYTSTGELYFGMSDLDQSVKDLKKYNHASFSVSEAQTTYCLERGWDAEDPRCGRLVFNGPINKVFCLLLELCYNNFSSLKTMKTTSPDGIDSLPHILIWKSGSEWAITTSFSTR